jgi:hypothetical protein
MFSIVFHIVILLALALATITRVQHKQELLLTATSVSGEPTAEPLETIQLDAAEDFELSEPNLESVVPVVSELTLADIGLPATSDAPSATRATAVAAVKNVTGQRGAGVPTRPAGPARSSAVHFCGTSAVGTRFAFVVDNSNSMVDGRMLATIDQLLRAVDAMQLKQAFFVVLYSDTAYPMFFPDAAQDFAMATGANKRRLREWLKTIEINPGGDLESAMELVFDLRPEAVFILGDGTGLGETERQMLTGFEPRRRCVINTIALGAGRRGIENLREIALVNGGQFQAFQTHPIFVEMEKSARFRKNPPGNTWSQRVGRR